MVDRPGIPAFLGQMQGNPMFEANLGFAVKPCPPNPKTEAVVQLWPARPWVQFPGLPKREENKG